MASYTDAQRAIAIEAVQRNGGVLDVSTLDTIRAAIEAPQLSKQLIYHWLKTWDLPQSKPESKSLLISKKPTAPSREELGQKAAEALDEMLERAARKFVERATTDEIVNDAKLQPLMTSAAIAIDKMRLLRNLPTEIVGLLPQLMTAADARGVKLSDVFNAMLIELSEVTHADGE